MLNAGSHILTATFAPTDAVNYTTATATVTLVVTQVTPVITWATPAPISYGTALGATQLNATTPVAGSFVYSSPLGTVLNAGSHTLTATFTPTDAVNYTTATATVTLEVAQATPVITWPTPAGIAVRHGAHGDAAECDDAGRRDVCLFVAARDGAERRQPHADGDVYADRCRELHHGDRDGDARGHQATPVITWATPAGIAYGTALSATQLNATTPVAGTFAYSPPLGTVLNAGSHTLTATFTPTDAVNYTTATATVTLVVTQATPVDHLADAGRGSATVRR